MFDMMSLSCSRSVLLKMFIYYFISLIFISTARRIQYISTEHPAVTYYNRKYAKYANLTSQRYSRSNPFYYVGLHLETLVTISNNVSVHFYFYEFLTNVYKRSFIEMHFKLCDLIHNDNFFGAPMKQGKFLKPCPHPPIRYISTEQPAVTICDRRYFKYANLTSQRYSRSNPFYYVGMHVETLVTFDNNITVNFYFYEFLTNVYKRGFIEMHFKWCDFIHNDNFFGAPMRQGKLLKPCPHPPGQYHLNNMTIDSRVIPPGFPFRKGRIYANITHSKANEVVLGGYINMEVKEVNIK